MSVWPLTDPEKAYFGNDPSHYASESSLSGLLKTNIPLMAVSSELDLQGFVKQLELFKEAKSAVDQKTYEFRLSGSVLRFDGFLKVYEVTEEKKADDDEDSLVGRAHAPLLPRRRVWIAADPRAPFPTVLPGPVRRVGSSQGLVTQRAGNWTTRSRTQK